MRPDKIKRLGRSGVTLTALGLGTAPFGELFEPVSRGDVDATVERAWSAGVRYFDTAPFYGHGKSELRVGQALSGKRRRDFILSTKVGRLFHRPHDPAFRPAFWQGALPLDFHFDYSYDGIMRSVEDSVQRLGSPDIDILLIHDLDTWHHNPDALTAHRGQLLTSGWRALRQLRESGVVKAVGAGINERGMMSWFLSNLDLDLFLVALRYTLLDQEVLGDEFPLCQERGVGIVVGGVFNSGILATGAREGARYDYAPASEEMLRRVEQMEAVCESHGVKLASAALQFPLAHEIVASVIPGALSEDQFQASIDAIAEEIPAGFWSDLKNEKLIRPDAPVPG